MDARRVRILAVDDEPSVGRAIRRLLADAHEVEITTDARDALARIHAGTHYDLILCDLMMPRMNGMDLHAALLERGDDAGRMIFLTGGAYTTRARQFLERIPNAWIEKPFDGGLLRRAVSDALRLRGLDPDASMHPDEPAASPPDPRRLGVQQPR